MNSNSSVFNDKIFQINTLSSLMNIETNTLSGMNYANSSPKKKNPTKKKIKKNTQPCRMDTGQEQTSISSEHASTTLN